MPKLNRRYLLAAAAAAGATGIAGGFFWAHRPRRVDRPDRQDAALPADADFPNALKLPGADGLFGVVETTGVRAVTAKRIRHPILPGKPTQVLAYEVEHLGKTSLNPVL